MTRMILPLIVIGLVIELILGLRRVFNFVKGGCKKLLMALPVYKEVIN